MENVETILKLFAMFEHGIESMLKLLASKSTGFMIVAFRGNIRCRTRASEFTEAREGAPPAKRQIEKFSLVFLSQNFFQVRVIDLVLHGLIPHFVIRGGKRGTAKP